MDNNKKKLDYTEIIFRQIDRCNFLFTKSMRSVYGGTSSAPDTYLAVHTLHSLVSQKFSKADKVAYYDKMMQLGLLYRSPESNFDYQKILLWYDILMFYISNSNLLPRERVSYETGVD